LTHPRISQKFFSILHLKGLDVLTIAVSLQFFSEAEPANALAASLPYASPMAGHVVAAL
jgi:hypothetical protein